MIATVIYFVTFVSDFAKSSKREITRCVPSHQTAIYVVTFVRDEYLLLPIVGFFKKILRLIDDIVVINCVLHFLVTNSTFCSIYSLLSREGVGLGFHSNVRRVN